MRRPIPILLLAGLLGGPLAAGASVAPAQAAGSYEEGLRALEAGEPEQAVAVWTALAEQGEVAALYGLGRLYEVGARGFAPDKARAAGYYREAAAGGVVAAQNNLALLYARGDGVARDIATAAGLWRQAAERGHPTAQYNLGLLSLRGEGVARDEAQGARWIRKAAEAGVPAALFVMGDLERYGVGVEQDPAAALAWYRRAVAAGYGPARAEVERLQASGVLARAQPAEEAGGGPGAQGEAPVEEEAVEEEADPGPGATRRGLRPSPARPDDLLQAGPLPEVADAISRAVADRLAAGPRSADDILPPSAGVAQNVAPAETAEARGAEAVQLAEAVGPEEAAQVPSEPAEVATDVPAGAAGEGEAATAVAPAREVAADIAPERAAPLAAPDPAAATAGPETASETAGSETAGSEIASPEIAAPEIVPAVAAEAPFEAGSGTEGRGGPWPSPAKPASLQIAAAGGAEAPPPGSFGLWLGSAGDERAAARLGRSVARRHRALLEAPAVTVRRVEVAGLGALYRVFAGAWPERAEAERACLRLRAADPAAFCSVAAH